VNASRLIIPCAGSLSEADARLVQIADYCGVPWQKINVRHSSGSSPLELDASPHDSTACLVINPSVLRRCLAQEELSCGFADSLTTRFPFLFVYALNPEPFTNALLHCLSDGAVRSVCAMQRNGHRYRVSADLPETCRAFSGLHFDSVNDEQDRVLVVRPGSVRTLIAIDELPFVGTIERNGARILFLARQDVVDLSVPAGDINLSPYFSGFVPAVMLLRQIFGDTAWHPRAQNATIIVDDPLLQPTYGFLSYKHLLGLMEKYDFHTTIAFIPYNHRRTSPVVARLFVDRSDRFSLCFHGNDHTGAEFATERLDELNTMLRAGLRRMDDHQQSTAIEHQNIMVFPQGLFSANAMRVLKLNGFAGAVNSIAWPYRAEPVDLTLRDLIEPAILRYDGFPLFLRRNAEDYTPEEIAFYLFLGKPVLICAHHHTFKDAHVVTNLVSFIHSIAPELKWASLKTSLCNSGLRRREVEGSLSLLTYTTEGEIRNESSSISRCVVKTPHAVCSDVEQVLVGGIPWPTDVSRGYLRWSCDLAPGDSRSFKVVYTNELALSTQRRTLRRSTEVFLRRRLSEIRDNYLSKNASVLCVAQSLRRHLMKSP
jgi:hypothetical protein